jgi:hypothetical protein
MASQDFGLVQLCAPVDTALVIVSDDTAPTSEFIKSRDWAAPVNDLMTRLHRKVSNARVVALPAARVAVRVLGDATFANLMLRGVAWQGSTQTQTYFRKLADLLALIGRG